MATTLDDAISIQKSDSILYPPIIKPTTIPSGKVDQVASSGTLSVGLYNSTTSSTVYAYITGLAIDNASCLFLLSADGATSYYPANPTSNGAPLSTDCAIVLGAPGTTRTVTIPHIAGGRIWFSIGSPLTFLLNPSDAGPGLVEPCVNNTADPNYLLTWDFCEFTYSSSQIYTNISYVDFVSIPIALTLTSTTGTVQHVSGLPSNGLNTICTGLIAQNATDGAGWDQLVVKNNGSYLRALSPSNGIVLNPSLFATYWNNYIDAVWGKYVSTALTIDTQASWGISSAYTSNDRTSLTFGDIGSFTKPSSTDIFGAASGAFAAQGLNTDQLLNIGARLDAGFNRSTLLIDGQQPGAATVSEYYQNPITNHYARIVHAANVDGKGYCFPYDDVTPDGGADQSGFLSDPSPQNFLVTVGGGNAYVKRDHQAPEKSMKKRSLGWEEDVKTQPYVVNTKERDLERGEDLKLLNEIPDSSASPTPAFIRGLDRVLGPQLAVSHSNPLI